VGYDFWETCFDKRFLRIISKPISDPAFTMVLELTVK
jgi:hypothetical protein